MSCALTQNYVLDCGDSKGGVKEAYIIEFPNVTSITQSAGVVTSISMAGGKFFWKYELTRDTCQFSNETISDVKNGISYEKQSVKLVINKMKTAVRNEIKLLAVNRLIFIMKDANGTFWMLGMNNGLNMTTTPATSGTAISDRNGYELNFEGMEEDSMIEVDPEIISSLID